MSDAKQEPASFSLEAAQVLADRGEYRDAIATLNTLLTNNSRLGAAWKLKGDCLMALQRDAESLASYDQAVFLEPFEAEHWYARGCLFDEMGAYGSAIADYNRAIMLAPESRYQAAKAAIYEQKKLVLAA